MKKLLTATSLALIAAVSLAGCSIKGSEDHGKKYTTVAEVAEAYAAAGGNCASPTKMTTLPGNDALMCADSAIVTLMGVDNTNELYSKIEQSKMPNGYIIIGGGNWTVVGTLGDKAPDIAASMGGNVLKTK